MTEETPSPAEESAPEQEAERADAAEPADQGEGPEAEGVTELPQAIQPEKGDIPPAKLDELRPICTLAEQKYQTVRAQIKEIRAAQDVLRRFQAREEGLTPVDVDNAKKKFNQAKQSYLQSGNQINDGIKQVFTVARTYPDDLTVQSIYQAYLAKLLASLETRNAVEPLVELLAAAEFRFEPPEVSLSEAEEQRGVTLEKKRTEMLEATGRVVNMLEVRYRKRQLANRVRQGERPAGIVKHVRTLLRRDREDLHTYIWLAKLVSNELEKERNQNKRVEMRDEVLELCKKAFSMIDDFLALQRITIQADRDRRRAEYVKSITAIRKPLIAG